MQRLWLAFAAVLVVSFAVLGWIGTRIYQEMPPLPDPRRDHGRHSVIVDAGDIGRGQNVWQSMGGMEVGSIWGHGSYVAPDWTADWLHREAVFMLDEWAQAEFGKAYAELDRRRAGAACAAGSRRSMRTNTYDPATRTRHDRPGARAGLRGQPARTTPTSSCKGNAAYAIPAGAVTDPGAHAAAGRVLLLDLLGRRRRTGPATTSPTPTTGRTSRWSATGRPAKRWSGPA